MKKEHAMKCRLSINCGLNHDLTPMPPEDCTCDGYHTFDELYDHRISLYIALCKKVHEMDEVKCAMSGMHRSVYPYFSVWKSKRHSDGELCFGTGTQFVLGIGKGYGKQVTYHIPIERWNEVDFVLEELEKAPEWDGHSSDDVIDRLKNL